MRCGDIHLVLYKDKSCLLYVCLMVVAGLARYLYTPYTIGSHGISIRKKTENLCKNLF